MSNVLRNIPSVSELLESPPLKSLVNRVNRNVVVTGVRRFLDDMRMQVQSAAASVHVPAPAELAQRIADWIATDQQTSLVPVVNATGFILHAELGRAPLAEEAIQAVAAVSRGYTNLEIDLASGEPCQRVGAVESLLIRVTGAEAATVVNNHAAATLLTLAALATGREVLVSRGQLIETGDKYRLPQIISARTERSAKRADQLFSAIAPSLIRLEPEEAEVAKLFTNTWRYIKFAAANQMFMIANDFGLDFARIRAALKQDYPRAADMPGPGLAARTRRCRATEFPASRSLPTASAPGPISFSSAAISCSVARRAAS